MALKRPFRVSGGSAKTKENFFICLNDKYFGEAAGSVFYGPRKDEILSDLEKGAEYIRSRKRLSISDLKEISKMEINSISKAALVAGALHFISGTSLKYPWQILNLDEPHRICTSYTVSIDSPESMFSEIRKSEYPIIKIKMGFEGDETLIEMLQKIPGKIYRIDANGGWNPEKAEKMIDLLARLDVALIEQPTSIDHISEWRYLKRNKSTPLFIDEGLNSIDDYYNFAGYIDGVNIKMAKSGGPLGSIKIARAARKDKRKVMLGCMVESSLGVAPALYLASLADYFDLDGPLLLEKDVAGGVNFILEKIEFGEDIIGGPKVKTEFLYETPIN